MSNTQEVLAKGLVERIGLEKGNMTHKPTGGEKFEVSQSIPDHTDGINLILAALTSKEHGVISELKEIDAVGHRVAHGGEYFSESAFVSPEAKENIKKCCGLAPLHNPANLKGIEAMESLLPGIPQVAAFDTSFHQTMPDYAYQYAIPYKYYENYKIRRYGFHGTSHKFVAEKACDNLNWNIEDKKIVTCHLGNGASICAVKNGKSIDTSMGFTPVEGLMMGTRSGDLDLGALLYIAEKEDLSMEETNNMINKESGLQGFSGISSDMRDLENAAKEGNYRAELAMEMFSYRVKKYIGAYVAAMDGVDLIIFTGGIGENDVEGRKRIADELTYLGANFDEEKNNCRGVDCNIISTPDSTTKMMVVTTDEELVIARDTKRIVEAI
jgi:acetate kinase